MNVSDPPLDLLTIEALEYAASKDSSDVKPCPMRDCTLDCKHEGLHQRADGFMWLDEERPANPYPGDEARVRKWFDEEDGGTYLEGVARLVGVFAEVRADERQPLASRMAGRDLERAAIMKIIEDGDTPDDVIQAIMRRCTPHREA